MIYFFTTDRKPTSAEWDALVTTHRGCRKGNQPSLVKHKDTGVFLIKLECSRDLLQVVPPSILILNVYTEEEVKGLLADPSWSISF